MTAAMINEILSARRKYYFLPKHTITIFCKFFSTFHAVHVCWSLHSRKDAFKKHR